MELPWLYQIDLLFIIQYKKTGWTKAFPWQDLLNFKRGILEMVKENTRSGFWCFDIHSSLSFFFLFSFYGHRYDVWKFLGQGSNQSCSCRPKPQPQQHWTQAAFVNYMAACGNTWSLTNLARWGIKPTSSQMLCQVPNPLSHDRNSICPHL